MASNKVVRRGRPPKQSIDHWQVVTDWKSVPLLCDIGIVACILGKKYEATRRLFISGKLPGFLVGCEWRIRKDTLMEHLGYQPWEIDKYGYGMAVDRQDRLQDQREAGAQMMIVIEEGAG